jgi:hypothetical protein
VIQDDSGNGVTNKGAFDLPPIRRKEENQHVDLGPDRAFVVKDSGKREEYENGFVRDTEEGKPDYARVLAVPGLHLIPIEMLERLGEHLVKGAVKYGEDNWRKATGSVAKERFARSLARHVRQLITGDRDEDHAAAIVFNAFAYELTPAEVVEPSKEELLADARKFAEERSKGPGSTEYKEYWCEVADNLKHPSPCECTS